MKPRRMKPVTAWIIVGGVGNMAQFFHRDLFKTRDMARRMLGEMGKHGWRVARVVISELPTARRGR